ncbi:Sodium/calcium exchanger membrane region [Cordyceps fumosorosea ARSEF 2679]|uniref:Sodium/calcium exchanger membrane region n=1 Tax=Cordyceps fumosorosea (strain ARSEF 2679) TaxID=1081104 RepID=A0A168AIV1_CORFA|nr:Sodium/calcium exchanger membrane region [Cordyceps fumosorosea ARSEF 2679]OAA68807.1 Sodium/calcium exchanger membrane region [Cordyceps fumosorosea ARSEF 2679]
MKEDSPVPPDIDGQPSISATTNTGIPGLSSSTRPSGRIQPSPGSLGTNASAPIITSTSTSTNSNITSTRQDSNGLERASTSPTAGPHAPRIDSGGFLRFPRGLDGHSVSALSSNLSSVTSPQDEGQGSVIDTKEQQLDTFNRQNTDETTNGSHVSDNVNTPSKRTFIQEARRTFWLVATHSWMNLLLIFVPVGIVVANIKGINGGIVFAMNCIAVVPLAGLLSHATESVASNMGDALGALLNITFGNAVELIIFIIALSKNEIRIVQASLLGSILANLLLILGMGFFLGGLRFREQVYNSTVTQMSACLLSLSVISLVLPTAFHASFKDDNLANERSLKISRGTSVILLLVYMLYLLFQLKSHAYMYESTPQHIVDAEAIPGPAAGWLNSSSSDDSSSSSSDSDDSSRSKDTVRKRMRKVLRPRRRTKSSTASQDGYDKDGRSSSIGTNNTSPRDETGNSSTSLAKPPFFPRMPSVDNSEEAIEEDEAPRKHGKDRRRRKHRHSSKTRHKFSRRRESLPGDGQPADNGTGSVQNDNNEPKRVDFALPKDTMPTASEDQTPPLTGDATAQDQTSTRRPAFQALRTISVRNLAPTVFVQKPDPADLFPAPPPGPVPRVRYGIRRTNSLPDRLSQSQQFVRAPGGFFPAQVPLTTFRTGMVPSAADPEVDDDGHLTKWAAIILLLITTGLVAVCAEFLVGSIKDVTSESSSVGEIFIGLIILPIVGNAAEHVTAITVAMKNKMDLAIGVAVGSSIQIALFVTPLIVILGWIMNREMTLYFTLFETVCLFVSTFIVNFLVLDGRSNYLEGALLCAVYVIIAVVAFFYPSPAEASSWGS